VQDHIFRICVDFLPLMLIDKERAQGIISFWAQSSINFPCKSPHRKERWPFFRFPWKHVSFSQTMIKRRIPCQIQIPEMGLHGMARWFPPPRVTSHTALFPSNHDQTFPFHRTEQPPLSIHDLRFPQIVSFPNFFLCVHNPPSYNVDVSPPLLRDFWFHRVCSSFFFPRYPEPDLFPCGQGERTFSAFPRDDFSAK